MHKDQKTAKASSATTPKKEGGLKLIRCNEGEDKPGHNDLPTQSTSNSAFAQMLNNFCDALDKQIESIKLQ